MSRIVLTVVSVRIRLFTVQYTIVTVFPRDYTPLLRLLHVSESSHQSTYLALSNIIFVLIASFASFSHLLAPLFSLQVDCL